MDVTDIVKTWYSSSKSIPGTYTEIENNVTEEKKQAGPS